MEDAMGSDTDNSPYEDHQMCLQVRLVNSMMIFFLWKEQRQMAITGKHVIVHKTIFKWPNS